MEIAHTPPGHYPQRVISREQPNRVVTVKKINIELKLLSLMLKKMIPKDRTEKLISYKPVKILGRAQKEQRVE